jgi:hypothetical protein
VARTFIPLALFLGLTAAPAAAGPRIQEYLASLRLGDTLEQVRRIYPPTRDWPKYREPGGGVVRINIERGFAKWFPAGLSSVRLGLRRGRLAYIRIVYDKKESQRKPLEQAALDLSLLYGEPRRSGEAFFWHDGRRVLAVSDIEVPASRGAGVELRTSIDLMEKDYFEP